MGGGTTLGSPAHLSVPAFSLVAFHPDPTRLMLLKSAKDNSISVWSQQYLS